MLRAVRAVLNLLSSVELFRFSIGLFSLSRKEKHMKLSRIVTVAGVVLALTSYGVARAEHAEHAKHSHQHKKNCGHKAEKHGDHEDYEHDGHHHKGHDGHMDECSGPEADAAKPAEAKAH